MKPTNKPLYRENLLKAIKSKDEKKSLDKTTAEFLSKQEKKPKKSDLKH